MRHEMRPLPFEAELRWALAEWKSRRSLFGVPESLFWVPRRAPYASVLNGRELAAPLGPAAGPHTQMARNIVAAWLSGARFIELKTVQAADELEIPRPCIDMADEGYNVEWSQELRLPVSADQYIQAWFWVHLLPRLLGWADGGTVFNMSVGYDLAGILSPPMQEFMDHLTDASRLLADLRKRAAPLVPEAADLEIPQSAVTGCTLSTMHGCPPDEIERIGTYLLEERGLHLTVKLNPTLLGREDLLLILHDDLAFDDVVVPDEVFAKDLAYPRALKIIGSLREKAARRGLSFAVKLTNTLAVANGRGLLPGEEMYLSGRPLFPLAVELFRRLRRDCGDELEVSFSAGADAFNAASLFACGAGTVTMASDLLRPGGTARLVQVLENLENAMHDAGAPDLESFSRNRGEALARLAQESRRDGRYRRDPDRGAARVESALGLFDCVEAPCVAACPVGQDVPLYARLIAEGRRDEALATILRRNPLPGVTGYVCTHLCQRRCARLDYDEPVAIRALKNFAAASGGSFGCRRPATGRRVAVVGAGPSGLAAASRLALEGVAVTLFEAEGRAGGMMALAPTFRLPPEALDGDVRRIVGLGVDLRLDSPVKGPPERLLHGFDAVYVATGFPRDASLDLEGFDGEGVRGALELLRAVASGDRPDLGRTVVIGGGNTAVDAARTAARLTGLPVTVVYRRSRREMPASVEEVELLLEEGNVVVELASPQKALRRDGRLCGLECRRNRLGEPDSSGRRRPLATEETFTVEADSVVVAVGQAQEEIFFRGSRIVLEGGRLPLFPSGRSRVAGLYGGGDLARGPETVIAAVSDGLRAAEAIARSLGIDVTGPEAETPPTAFQLARAKVERARKSPRIRPPLRPGDDRKGFDPVEMPFDEASAAAEARRCLQCADLCDRCVDVCPNRANVAYAVFPTVLTAPVVEVRGGAVAVVGSERVAFAQPRQIVHVEELCNGCGNCATFCVHQGRPYEDKPRLFLRRSAFDAEEDRALLIDDGGLLWKDGGRTVRMERLDGGWRYDDGRVEIVVDETFLLRSSTVKEPFEGPLSLAGPFRMAFAAEGIVRSAPFLAAARRALE